MMTRRTQIVRPRPHLKSGFGRDQNLVAPPGDGLAENRLREPVGINVGRVKKIHASVEADVYKTCRFRDVARAPGFEEFVSPTKCSRAKTQHRYFQSRASQRSEFHASIDAGILRGDSGMPA